jgi:hypothetical protein
VTDLIKEICGVPVLEIGVVYYQKFDEREAVSTLSYKTMRSLPVQVHLDRHLLLYSRLSIIHYMSDASCSENTSYLAVRAMSCTVTIEPV